ncbi:MAG TPA: hypothetical protein VI874_02225, partial [Candidatus Norongarragalinales archaeon]|nr:hypothetical protein [Candidatus Norongarragalinales archaeon]
INYLWRIFFGLLMNRVDMSRQVARTLRRRHFELEGVTTATFSMSRGRVVPSTIREGLDENQKQGNRAIQIHVKPPYEKLQSLISSLKSILESRFPEVRIFFHQRAHLLDPENTLNRLVRLTGKPGKRTGDNSKALKNERTEYRSSILIFSAKPFTSEVYGAAEKAIKAAFAKR